MDWKTLFLSPEGRIGRQAFWIGWLVLLGVNMALGWLPMIGAVISLATIYSSVCIHSKRLHDMGQTGWWQVLHLGAVLGVLALSRTGRQQARSGGLAAPLVATLLSLPTRHAGEPCDSRYRVSGSARARRSPR